LAEAELCLAKKMLVLLFSFQKIEKLNNFAEELFMVLKSYKKKRGLFFVFTFGIV
jgi:hypothetical protein